MQSTPNFPPMGPSGGMNPAPLENFSKHWICRFPALDPEVEASIEVSVSHPGIRNEILLGLVDPRTGRGIALAIDPTLGLVRDLINDEGVIGFFENQPFYEQPHHCLKLSFETYPHIMIPQLHIHDEIILLPSMFLDTEEVSSLQGVVGSTRHEGFFYRFEDCHIQSKSAVRSTNTHQLSS